jgi:hypothetical protein
MRKAGDLSQGERDLTAARLLPLLDYAKRLFSDRTEEAETAFHNANE